MKTLTKTVLLIAVLLGIAAAVLVGFFGTNQGKEISSGARLVSSGEITYMKKTDRSDLEIRNDESEKEIFRKEQEDGGIGY